MLGLLVDLQDLEACHDELSRSSSVDSISVPVPAAKREAYSLAVANGITEARMVERST